MKPNSSTSLKKSKAKKDNMVDTSATFVGNPSVTKLKKTFPKKHKLSNTIGVKQKKLSKSDSWKTYDKTAILQVLKELCNEENTFLSDDPKIVEEVVKKVQIKLKHEKAGHTDKGIKVLLQYLIRTIDKQRFIHDEPIDKWLEQIRALTPSCNHLEQQLKSALTVAIEEPIPEFSNKKVNSNAERSIPEPDYGAVYKYLACAVADLPLPELSPINSLLVEDCMQSLMEQIKSLDDSDLRLNLRRVYLYLNKVEGQAPEEEEETIKDQLAKGDIFNPLGINQNLIVPVPPD